MSHSGQDWDVEADIVVVGAGAAGTIAAGAAAVQDPAARIVVLEKDSAVPCNSAIASGFIPAAGTRFQRDAGIDDSAETHAEDILAKNNRESDPALTLALCRRAADAVHWLSDVAKVPIEFAPEIDWYGHSRSRMHGHATRSGGPIIDHVRTFLTSLPNLELFDSAPATELVIDDSGTLAGINAGSACNVACRQVVLACGGFGGNAEMVAKYIPEMAAATPDAGPAWHIGARSNTGEGILWGLALGAQMAQPGAYQGRDSIAADGTRVTPGVITGGGIAVDLSGHRFAPEDHGYSELAAVYRQQDRGFVVLIWDEQIQRTVEKLHIQIEAERSGDVLRFENVRALARHHGMSENVVAATLDDYRRAVETGTDSVGRKDLPRMLVPPYYTAKVTGALAHTQGGLKVDSLGRVLTADGEAIPGLFAAGNTAVGVSGAGSGGYLSGNGLMAAFSGGLIAGEAAIGSLDSDY